MLGELGARDQWRGKIFLDLHHAQNPDETIVVTPARFDRDWLYRIELPDLMDRSRFVSAMVEVLLLEMANRNATQSTEIPAWLVQGLSRQMQLSSQGDLVLDPAPKSPNNNLGLVLFHSNRRTDPLTEAHNELHTYPPLTLEQLSWPAEWQFTGDAGEAYRSSAQLFVHELLQLHDGRASLLAMLQDLPQHLNWQIAFLQAFHTDFASQLALEKWWDLRLVQFTGRDLAQTWPADESWNKLDEILRPAVQIRAGAGDLPLRTQVTLESVIKEWDVPRQKILLREKIQQLAILRLRVSQDLVYLVDDYRRILDSYLNRKDYSVYVPMSRTIYPSQLDTFARDTLRQLADLEVRRGQLRPQARPRPRATRHRQHAAPLTFLFPFCAIRVLQAKLRFFLESAAPNLIPYHSMICHHSPRLQNHVNRKS